jgi:hypothetical protein
MDHKTTGETEVLLLTAEENYAHARDHEHLRAQVTSTLVAAAFVLVGLALNANLSPAKLAYVAAMTLLIGILNVVVVIIHDNRAERHISIARCAKHQIANVTAEGKVRKLMNLSLVWRLIAGLPIIAAVGLLLVVALG